MVRFHMFTRAAAVVLLMRPMPAVELAGAEER